MSVYTKDSNGILLPEYLVCDSTANDNHAHHLQWEKDEILKGCNVDGLIEALLQNPNPPKKLFIGCTDYRISIAKFFNLVAGSAFVQRQVGGFFIKDIEKASGFNASIAVATGIKGVEQIFLMTHSDCAAAKVALHYPVIGQIPNTIENHNVLQAIQNYVLHVADDIPKLSWLFQMLHTERRTLLPPEDLMAIQLGIRSYENFMSSKLYENQTKTVAQMVREGRVSVTLLHLDLGKRSAEYSDKFVRVPALYVYDPVAHSFKKNVPMDFSQFDGMLGLGLGGGCQCADEHGAIDDASSYMVSHVTAPEQMKYAGQLILT